LPITVFTFDLRSDFVAVTMLIGRTRINLYLLCFAGLAAVLVAGCRTGDSRDKQFSALRLHMEATSDAMSFSRVVPIYRENPMSLRVDRDPFLTEVNVASAKVVDEVGGFVIQIQFDRRGAWLLEQYTTSNPGRRVAIYSEFGGKGFREARWLGAPTIRRRISDGLFTFTPDATRAEAEEVVLGLNNLARKLETASKW